MARRRAEFFAGKHCVDCEATEELTIDHRDPGQKVSHRIWSWAAERRLAELAKCDVRCSDCHRSRHAQFTQQHGTYSRHRAGCRCDPCVAVARATWARWRRRKSEAKD